MTKTLNRLSCHAHPEAKARTQCVECGQKACARRCFLNGRTKYCKPCRDRLKQEAEASQERTEETMDKVELAFDVVQWVSESFPAIGAVIALAACGALFLGIHAVSVIFSGF